MDPRRFPPLLKVSLFQGSLWIAVATISLLCGVVSCSHLETRGEAQTTLHEGTVPEDSTCIVLLNGVIYTVNPEQPWAEAILVQDGRIAAVGPTKAALSLAPEGCHQVNLDGRLVLPGFQDPHLHVVEAGINEDYGLLPAFASSEEYARRIRRFAEEQEHQTGSIEVGKLADLIVIDHNIFNVPPDSIRESRVELTLLGGDPIFDPNKLFAK